MRDILAKPPVGFSSNFSRDQIMRMFKIMLVVLTGGLLLVTAAQAQSLFPTTSGADTDPGAALLTEQLSENEANALISRLSDEQVRAVLLEQMALKAQVDAVSPDDALSTFIYHATTGALQSVTIPIELLPKLVVRQGDAFETFFATLGVAGVAWFVLMFCLTLIVGLVAEFAFRHVTRRWHELPPPDPETVSLRNTIKSLLQRLCRDVVAVAVFIITTMIVSRLLIPAEAQVYASLVGFYLIAFPRVAWAISRFIMAPENSEYRIVYATDENARGTVFHSVWMAVIIGFSVVIIEFNELNGVPRGELRLGFWLNALIHFYIGLTVWRYRDGMVDMMRGPGEVTPAEERVARAFPVFAILVSAGTWWLVNIIVSYGNFELLAGAPHYVTMGLLLFAPAMDTAIRGAVRHLAPAMSGEGVVAERAYHATVRSYIRIGRVIVFGIVLVIIADAWGIDPAELAAAGVGERLAANALEFLIIVSFGYLVYEITSLFINRKLAAEITATGYDPDNAEFGGDGGGAGGSRLSTVLPLIMLVSRVTIVVVFMLLALGNVGVDTTPLLAGAGIVGLAIGFGAQKLVTDIVSGIFFLVDDAFRTGEYVTIEGTMGTVEKISIRSMQLRHHKGPVHTIPYGEIPKITNFSRDWVIMKLRFTVPFDTDPNKVKKIFKKIGQDLLETEELGGDFLQPFKSQGVLEIDDVGLVIRGKFMAKPGKQFMIRKEIFNRVSAAFAEAGIDFARREVRVALPDMDHRETLTEEDKAAIAAAATQAAQEQVPEGGPGKDNR